MTQPDPTDPRNHLVSSTPIPKDASVFMVVTSKNSEGVLYQILVGGLALAKLLKEASLADGYPVYNNEDMLDVIGQDIYVVGNKEYVFSILGTFTAIPWGKLDEVRKLLFRDDLTFSFVASF
jgi:hypothetical protein